MKSITAQQLRSSQDLHLTDLGRMPSRLYVIGAAALGLTFVVAGFATDGMSRLFHAYLLSLCFFLSISLGALFFVVLQHLTGARWSVVLRRIAELLMSALPTLGLLMIPLIAPLLWGSSELYRWNDSQLLATDQLIQSKAPFLNAPFFTLRCVIYFALWLAIAKFYFARSVAQDSAADDAPTLAMRKWSGPSMLAFALTVNFAAFDWLMSLDPHWFSTIFGIYFFAGCVVALFATLVIVSAILQRYGYATQAINTEHYHDLGKLLFGFNFFWAYIAFSQFLLIWYANIPEETVWFLHRQEHGWQYIGILLILGHFVVPFLGLMSRHVRRNRKALLFWSVFLLAMHWVDLFWLVIPSVSPDAVSLGLAELLTFVGIGGVWLASVLRSAEGVSLVPTRDPHLSASLAFHNV